jgi:hypothetical protein
MSKSKNMSKQDDSDAARDSRRYNRLPVEEKDRLAEDWSLIIYLCPECDEEGRAYDECYKCPRYPGEHNKSGYMGTGTTYPADVRRLAKKIAADI